MSDSGEPTTDDVTWLRRALDEIMWRDVLLFVVAVLMVGSFLRSFVIQGAAEDAEDAGSEAVAAAVHLEEVVLEGRTISQATLDELRAVIARSQQSSSNTAVRDALEAIDRIEHELCGGKCPDVPEEAP